jgi:hypothetical protein
MTLLFLGDTKLERTAFVSLDNAAHELKNRELRKQVAGGYFFSLANNQTGPKDPT